MRLSLIIGVLALTALTFYAALRTLPAMDYTIADSASAALADATTQIELNRVEFDQQVAALNQEMADLRAENMDQATSLVASVAERDQLQSELTDTNERLIVLEAVSSTLTSEKGALTQELAGLTANLENSESVSRDTEATIQALNDEVEQGREELRTLQATVVELESESSELTQKLSEFENNAASLSAPAEGDVAQAQATLEQTAADLAEAEDRIAILTEMTTVQVRSEQTLTEEIDGLAAQVATLTDEASSLSDEVAKRDAVIAGLLAKTDTVNTPPEASCQERTNLVLADTQVSFVDGTTTLDTNAVPILEELAVIALDCAQDNLILEIEGHTGSAGGIASNLLLSDGRAKAVRDVLIESGVPAPAVRAVGFGGSEPIADNETSEGQSRNQRIVFDWEQN